MSWVSSAFNGDDDFDLEDISSKRSPARATMRTKQKTSGTSGVLWSEQHQPMSASELAVHRKKVQEVEEWLKWALDPARQSSREACILLLTGPAGCGKTATVRALARELGVAINEWLNPVTEAYHRDDWETGWSDIPHQESQSMMFGNFLRKAGRYRGVIASDGHSRGQKEIILVEDLPNAFYREPAKFHEVMRSQATCCLHPVVFIVSDTSRSESNATQLFPQHLISELRITHISFNPVALTLMVKALNRVISQHTRLNSRERPFFTPGKELIDALAESAGGDVRSAVNSLQFTCSKGTGGGKGKSSKSGKKTLAKRTRSASSMSEFLTSSRDDSKNQQLAGTLPAVLGSRDHSLFLFRSLGKVFYCKRSTATAAQNTHNIPTSAPSSSSSQLPAHLHMHERNPLEASPEEVLEHTQMSGDMFTLYLHQNYLDFFTDMDDIARGAGYLSDSTLLHQLDWSQVRMGGSADVGTIVACRGLMHANDPAHSTGKHSWRPLHKPEWLQVNKKYNSYCRAMKDLFLDLSVKGCSASSVVMQTELLPYLAVINVPLRNSAQVNLLQQVTHFTRRHVPRFISEKLGEKDVQGADEGTDLPDFDATSFSLSQPFNDAKHCAVAPKDATSEETSVLVDDIHDFSDAEDW